MKNYSLHVSRLCDGQRLSCGYFHVSAITEAAARRAAIKQAKAEYGGSAFRIEND